MTCQLAVNGLYRLVSFPEVEHTDKIPNAAHIHICEAETDSSGTPPTQIGQVNLQVENGYFEFSLLSRLKGCVQQTTQLNLSGIEIVFSKQN